MARNSTELKEVVDQYLIERGVDDYDKNSARYQVRAFALSGLREVISDVQAVIKQTVLTVQNNAYVNLPADYLRYTFIGVKGDDCKVYPLGFARNLNMTGSCTPVVDHDNNFIPDGFLLYSYLSGSNVNQLYGVPTGRNSNGYYQFNMEQNRIELSSEVSASEIVLEYFADVTLDANPTIPTEAVQAIKQHIYWRTIQRKRNIPQNEKQAARREWYNEKRLAKNRLRSFTSDELLQALRTGTKQAPKF